MSTLEKTDEELRALLDDALPCSVAVVEDDLGRTPCPNQAEWILVCRGCNALDFACDPCRVTANDFWWACPHCANRGDFIEVYRVIGKV